MSAPQKYSKVAIILHWVIALALAAEVAIGFGMPRDASGFELFQLHKSIGITILALSVLRLLWRLTHRPPAGVEGGVSGFLAKAVHVLFYVVMIGTPLTGWALVSTSSINVPTVLFGAIPIPHLPLDDSLGDLAHEAHEWLAISGIALFVLHVLGALRHHLMLKDGLLARMSFDKGGMALGLLAAVVLLGGGVFFGISRGNVEEHDHATDHEPQPEATSSELADDGHDHVHADEADETLEEDAADEESEAEEAEEETAEADEPAAGPPPSWAIQPGGSLNFGVNNGGMALNGSFASWSGDIVMDPDAPESAQITIRIDLSSASLGDGTQNAMMQGGDFLDVSSHPQAVWRSTSVRRISGNRFEADGTLSLKGASSSQRIVFTLSGEGSRRSVQGSATIDRNAYGVGTGSAADNLAGTVEVNFSFDAVS